MKKQKTVIHIGAHLSISKGYASAAETATQIGADTFQFFTRNPRGGSAKVFDAADVQKLKDWSECHSFAPLLAHAPYTINLASDSEQVRYKGTALLRQDLELMEKLPCRYYNLHPGSRQSASMESGVARIAECINSVLGENGTVKLLLETMSGKGSEIGGRFEELRALIDRIVYRDRVGVCMDTCHVFCAGYDIVNDLEGVINQFDSIIGLDRLCALHLNDSMHPIGSHRDRHEKIGQGYIGMDGFSAVLNHPFLQKLPMFLETPNEISGYADEIRMLRALVK
ncbi:MAG: deoxyribonuclease IV [Anaerofustis sp.]